MWFPGFKTRSMVVAIVALGVATLMVLVMINRPEPKYEGKTTWEWISFYSKRNLPPKAEVVKALGTNAVPSLRTLLCPGKIQNLERKIRTKLKRPGFSERTVSSWFTMLTRYDPYGLEAFVLEFPEENLASLLNTHSVFRHLGEWDAPLYTIEVSSSNEVAKARAKTVRKLYLSGMTYKKYKSPYESKQ